MSCLQDDTRDIFLDGIVARNRALNGDVVVVQILPQDQWKVGRYITIDLGLTSPQLQFSTWLFLVLGL